MEPVVIAVVVLILIVLVLLIPLGSTATRTERAHRQTLQEMHQVKEDARRQMRAINQAYRRQVASVARPQVPPPPRRTS
mgnify:CR=1 FL=1